VGEWGLRRPPRSLTAPLLVLFEYLGLDKHQITATDLSKRVIALRE
jgi:hypothetical protein